VITVQDLEAAIAECQGQRNPNANTCIKLAAYYTILNQMQGNKSEEIPAYSFAAEPAKSIDYSSDTEFYSRIADKPAEEVYAIMDELMTALMVVNPRLYDSVMRKL
jgi:hypothetical protein